MECPTVDYLHVSALERVYENLEKFATDFHFDFHQILPINNTACTGNNFRYFSAKLDDDYRAIWARTFYETCWLLVVYPIHYALWNSANGNKELQSHKLKTLDIPKMDNEFVLVVF